MREDEDNILAIAASVLGSENFARVVVGGDGVAGARAQDARIEDVH